MAGINTQGFKIIRKSYREIMQMYEIFEGEVYSKDGTLYPDRDFLWDRMCEGNDLYEKIGELLMQIKNTLQMLSDLKTKTDYEKMQIDLKYVKSQVVSTYEEIKEAIGEFSDSERRRMHEFSIELAI